MIVGHRHNRCVASHVLTPVSSHWFRKQMVSTRTITYMPLSQSNLNQSNWGCSAEDLIFRVNINRSLGNAVNEQAYPVRKNSDPRMRLLWFCQPNHYRIMGADKVWYILANMLVAWDTLSSHNMLQHSIYNTCVSNSAWYVIYRGIIDF